MTPAQHALGYVVEDRARELASKRHWYRSILRRIAPSLRPAYSDMYAEWTQELRALLRLRSKARRIARQAEVMRTAAVDQGMETWLDDMGRTVTFGGQVR